MKIEEIVKILEENKITNVGKNTPYTNTEKQYVKKTPSEEMQDELEPIPMPCPMHEDYDEKDNV